MRRAGHWVTPEDEQAGANRQTASLAALAVVLMLIVVSLLLVRELRSQAEIQDCVMSGSTNCVAAIPLQ